MREELRLGTAEGSGPQAFASIRAVELDAYGRLYILDHGSRQLRVFDARGQLVRAIGREGAGPGEFRNPIGLAWDRPGHLWVVDPGNARYSVFDTTGTLVRTYERRVGRYVYSWDGVIDRAGNLFEHNTVQNPHGDQRKRVLVRYAIAEDVVPQDTLPFPQPERKTEVFIAKSGSSTMYVPVPFAPAPISLFDGRNGTWTAVNDRYTLVHQTLSGDTTLIIEKPWQAESVTDSEIDELVATHSNLDASAKAQFRSMIPRTKPAFETFINDDEGRLWVIGYKQ
ncbi:MAG: 6-bladed beta-propeller, partial [Gemmatimonadota bacterium]